MIKTDTLADIQEAITRFQTALNRVRVKEMKRLAAAEKAYQTRRQSENVAEPWVGAYAGSPETAALRRASMDLTRALAELRRSPVSR